ncbi:biotin operon repressor and biotin (plasmid) [Legionella adelaidensis]|uniref:Biotin biosynthesis protein BioH n=1 Tax=Legionella adelaidensis TaxID=45056 RepID=A0A0W0R3Q6_9GAMM|nr:alpha/beta fold hydrolase [Legionella adelaidensis]KTC65666.1 biotin biosynthesis protein BioH [Legionella adelaidensis]VEH85138.1 biotin operon repressor and biotin [Legionella adelaidensis]
MKHLHINIFGTGERIVFFHGWGFDQTIWNSLLPELEKLYQIYLIDLPGFGKSSQMNWQTFKTQLLQVIPSPFTIVGWSLGGLYGLRLALEEKTQIKKLINVAAPPFFMGDNQWPGIDENMFKAFQEQVAKDPLVAVKAFIKLQDKRAALIQPLDENNIEKAALISGLNILFTWDFRLLIKELTKPIVFMFSKLDTIIPPKIIKVMKKSYPAFSYHEFPKAGHMPFLSHPQEFITALKEHL